MRLALILGLAGGLAALPAMAADQKDPDAAGVAEAIRFEKAKQAAADRQARIEAARAKGQYKDDAEAVPKPKAKTVKSAANSRKAQQPQRNEQ